MSSLKVSRCSHTNGSVEIQGAASPSGTEEVLMCEMCQAVLCAKAIRRWGTCLHGKYVRYPCIIVARHRICTFLHLWIFFHFMFGRNTVGYPLFLKTIAIHLWTFVSGRWRVKQNVGPATTSNEDKPESSWRAWFSFQLVFNQTAEGLAGIWLHSSYF